MNRRLVGLLGIGAWILFWAASVTLAAFRPSYSHIVNTISELGAVGTPHATAWNVLGFIIPGILLALTGATIARTANMEPSLSRTLATVLLVLCGLAIAGQGVMPAEMANGVADVTSVSTRGHFISSLISAATWVVGALLLVGPMKRNPNWQSLHIVSAALVALTLVASFALRGTLPDGLAQRIGNAFFCVWFILMSLKLVRLEAQLAKANSERGGGPV
ncbi:MAG TPA: DUF998 domain-containing protein [Vicinamibacterales bacterium]|jgi:hypothetical membrane protein